IACQCSCSCISVQLIIYTRRQRAAYAFDLRQCVHACGHESLQSAESRAQTLPPFGADARDAFERRRRARLAAPRAMPLNRETMRLVAYLLDQMQRRMFG